ncbi:MAG: winged helix-turn-helix domain-containing protein [Nitrososphaerota archaeon]|nr:winged helix-turn-helix domain-containing protein [Nitrososphaerota archaeon]
MSISRIFWKLFRNNEMSITQIIRQTGLNHKIVKKSLEKMINKGLIGEKSFGRMKIYSLNKDNPSIKILITLLDTPPMSFLPKDNRAKQFP